MESKIEILELNIVTKYTDKYDNMTAQLLRSIQQTDPTRVIDLENEDETYIKWYIHAIKYKDTPDPYEINEDKNGENTSYIDMELVPYTLSMAILDNKL